MDAQPHAACDSLSAVEYADCMRERALTKLYANVCEVADHLIQLTQHADRDAVRLHAIKVILAIGGIWPPGDRAAPARLAARRLPRRRLDRRREGRAQPAPRRPPQGSGRRPDGLTRPRSPFLPPPPPR